MVLTGDSVGGIYEINSTELTSGPHLFILNVQDVHGKTLMKVQQFSVGTGKLVKQELRKSVRVPVSHLLCSIIILCNENNV